MINVAGRQPQALDSEQGRLDEATGATELIHLMFKEVVVGKGPHRTASTPDEL